MQQIHIVRDRDGQITGLSATAGDSTEIATIDDPDVQQFLHRLDIDLVRVLEDVVDLLIARGVFRFTDLPESAQAKLMFRKNLRSQWQPVADPLGAPDDLF